MSIRPLGPSYANANLNAAVTVLTETGAGAAINIPSLCQRIRIAASGAGVWVKPSKGAVIAATAGAANEILIPAGTVAIIEMGQDWHNVSIINAGANCAVSVGTVDL